MMKINAKDRVVGVTSLSPEESAELQDIPQAEIVDEGDDDTTPDME